MEENHANDSNNNNGEAGEKPAVKSETPLVSIKVVNADGAEMFFKIKCGTQLKKLFDAYCKKQGISRSSVRFLFDGSPIDESKTPQDLGMEDDDVIDAMVEQTVFNMSESKLKLSREDVHEFVRAMTAEMQTSSFVEKLREAVKQEPIPTNESELIAVFEGLQVDFLTRYEATRKCGENEQQEKQGNATIPDGNAILQELREAVLHYPDKETEGMIRQMCMLQESQMLSVCASTPSLAPLVQPRGDGCQHAHCHGHGHSHGAPDAQQMMEMQMAIQSLSPQLRQDMTRIQQTIHSGQQPSGEDVLKMREIQSHIKAFITTLRQFNAGNAATKK